jgi:RNA polymerase sigma-70 factor (ECF subfamily)
MALTDRDHVAELYRRYGPAVQRRALSLTRDAQEALDVTQETFLAYLDGPGARSASPFTVLYQIATFKAVDRLRRRARWSGRLDLSADPEAEGGPAAVAPVDGSPERVDAARDLALLTKGEKPEVLTAALLYYVEGYTTDEVGQALDLSRKTVGRLLARFAERARKRSERLESDP